MVFKVVYGLEHINFGIGDERSGWWIVRYLLNTSSNTLWTQSRLRSFRMGRRARTTCRTSRPTAWRDTRC